MSKVYFGFELDTNYMRHCKEISSYNHNYYELDLYRYGDYITPQKCNLLYEEYDEFSNTYTYSLGYLENRKFKAMFTWVENECKTDEVRK